MPIKPRHHRFTVLCALGTFAVFSLCGCSEDPTARAIREALGDKTPRFIETFGAAEMPYNMAFNLPVCDAVLNDKRECRAVIDTGAGNAMLISKSVAEELGLSTIVEGAMAGFGGTTESGIALLDSLVLGEITVRNVLVMIAPESSPIMQLCDVLLGTGVFENGRVTLDFENALLHVEDSGIQTCKGHELTLALGESKHLFCKIDAYDRLANVMLDSGASVPCYSPAWLDRHLPERQSFTGLLPGMNFMAGVGISRAPMFTTVDFEFAGRTFERAAGIEMPDLDGHFRRAVGERIDMVLGVTIFRLMKRFTVDYPRESMWVEWIEEAE